MMNSRFPSVVIVPVAGHAVLAAAVLAVAVLLAAAPASAGPPSAVHGESRQVGSLFHLAQYDDDDDDHDDDRDDRRELDALSRAVRSGDILPLAEIKRRVASRFGPQIIAVEVERDDGRWVYEVKVVQGNGRLVEVELDGRTGRILDVDND